MPIADYAMLLPRARFMAEDSIGSEDISISGSSMSDTPPSSRWCGNVSLDSWIQNSRFLTYWYSIFAHHPLTCTSCSRSHNKKQGSPVLQRDSLRPGAHGAGSSGGDDEKLFSGSKPSWMSAPIKPGQFAASLGFKPVQIPAKASVTSDTPLEGGPGGVMPQKPSSLAGLSSVPKDGLAVATGAGKSVAPERSRLLIASSDSDSESNPRAMLVVHKHEDKPVHPAIVPSSSAADKRDSPISEEMDVYDSDWDVDEDLAPSKPEAPSKATTASAIAAEAPARISAAPSKAKSPPGGSRILMGADAIADLLAAADSSERAAMEGTGVSGGGNSGASASARVSPVPAARGLNFGASQPSSPLFAAPAASKLTNVAPAPSVSAPAGGGAERLLKNLDFREVLQDQSYATDSETEEQVPY